MNKEKGIKKSVEINFYKKDEIKFVILKSIIVYLHRLSTERSVSSVGLEHLPYKQGVVGSNPTRTTIT